MKLHLLSHRSLDRLLSDYEVTMSPQPTTTQLKWRSHVDAAVAPYDVTQVPHCHTDGLARALEAP